MNVLDQIPKPLLDDIVNGKCVPIIGSGFSTNAILPPGLSMPLWKDMGDHFSEILNFKFSNPIDALSAYSHEYSKAKLIEELWKILHISESKPGEAHLSFAKLPFTTVITTNFDILLERSFDSIGKIYQLIIDETQLSLSFSDRTNSKKIIPQLVKMHGDLNHPSNLVVIEEDYDTFLQNNPILATYISNILITKTPLFIGYSLDDPDFRGIFKMISNRLGELRRPAYIIKINPSKYDTNKYQRREVNIIGFNGKNLNYADLYQDLFVNLKSYWEEKVVTESYFMNEETLSEFALPKDSPSRLCYFAIPYHLSSYYRENIFPLVEQIGFQPILNTDVIETSENMIAKMSSLIDRSLVIIADTTTPTVSVLSEINMAKLKNKNIILLIADDTSTSDIYDIELVIKRPSDFVELDQKFIDEFTEQLVKFQLPKSRSYEEPLRLLTKKEYKAALISAFILLEYELTNYIKNKEDGKRCTISQAFNKSLEIGLINVKEYNKLRKIRTKRNILLHSRHKISKKQSTEYVTFIMNVLQKMRRNTD